MLYNGALATPVMQLKLLLKSETGDWLFEGDSNGDGESEAEGEAEAEGGGEGDGGWVESEREGEAEAEGGVESERESEAAAVCRGSPGSG